MRGQNPLAVYSTGKLLFQGQIISDPRKNRTATHLLVVHYASFNPLRLPPHVRFSLSLCVLLLRPACGACSPPPFYFVPVCRLRCLFRADLQSRDPETFKPLHVVNMTIKDSPEESAAAAGDVLELCRTVIKYNMCCV